MHTEGIQRIMHVIKSGLRPLCLKDLDARGNDIPDAYHAALALEWDCVWVTTDKGFKRFKHLKSRHPFELE